MNHLPRVTQHVLVLTPRPCGLPPRPPPSPHRRAPVNLGCGKGNKAPLHFEARNSIRASHMSNPWWQTINYLLSSMDAAWLTFSKSSMESVSRTCFCCIASSRRHSWTILDKLGEASFWEDAHSAPG